MAPVRKKSRLAQDNDDKKPEAGAQLQTPDGGRDHDGQSDTITTSTQEPPKATGQHTPHTKNRSSWYAASSWRSKASPVAQVVRESISVDKGVSSPSSDQEQDISKRRASQSVSQHSKGSSRKSVPLVGEATRVHATSAVSQPPQRPKKASSASQEKTETTQTQPSAVETKHPPPEEPLPSQLDVDMGDGDDKTDTTSVNIQPTSGSWFGWWSRPDDYGSDTEKRKNASKTKLDGAAEDGGDVTNTLASAPEVKRTEPIPPPDDSSTRTGPEMCVNPGTGRSWFGLWSSTQNQQAVEEDRQRRASEQALESIQDIPVQPENTVKAPTLPEAPVLKEITQESERPKSSGWAFWSKDAPKEAQQPSGSGDVEVGELAVADTPSQSHPEAAQFNQEREGQMTDKPDVKRSNSLLRLKRGRTEKGKDQSGETTAAATPSTSQLQTPAVSQFQTPRETPEGSPAPVQRGKKPQLRPNLILPSFRDTYPTAANPGVVEKLTSYVAQSLHIPGYETKRHPRHPYINPSPPKVKKAVAIGVHGYFPAVLLQRVIGQPTGTSIRFANYAAASIKQWCNDHQPDVKDVEVEKVALEGEGFISDRVTTLWKLLLNWLSHLRKADFIFVACHSQGVPVAIMLVAKLIQLGCLSPQARIGVCAMAGINLGPFAEYRSRFFGGTALELFEFCDRNSKVSVAYAEAMDICLRSGVRITFVGSIDDQLVSLESSLHVPLSHPYVCRTVFIDGRLHTSNFLTHLVVFALKLRNLGVSDHGLIRELSGPLAGSLVGGEGHSRVYDPEVFQNAVEFTLESTDLSASAFVVATDTPEERRKSLEAATQRRASLAGYPSTMIAANSMRRGSLSSASLALPGIAPIMAAYEAPGASGAAEKNPFVLPWAVRGMLGEDMVKHDPKLQEEVRDLVREFEAWRPTSKVLKDVRWRLEGVRSML